MHRLLGDVNTEHKDAIFTRYGGGDAVRTVHHRYMEMCADGGRGPLQGVGLFDLERDLQENQNVADDPAHGKVRRQLQTMLDSIEVKLSGNP